MISDSCSVQNFIEFWYLITKILLVKLSHVFGGHPIYDYQFYFARFLIISVSPKA